MTYFYDIGRDFKFKVKFQFKIALETPCLGYSGTYRHTIPEPPSFISNILLS